MDRLAKKCVIASSVLHGTLVLVLLVGPAFLPAEKPLEAKQIIDFIPYKTLETSISGGGNPNVEQTIPQPAPPTPARPTPAPQPRREEPTKREEPAKQETKAEPKSEPKTEAKSEDTSWKPSSKIKVNLKQTVRNTGSTSRSTSTTSRSTERAQALASAANSIDRGASSPVQVQDLRGPGGGGIPYAGFNDALVSAYMRAWLIPGDAADETSKVVVTITLSRDGRVMSSRIQSRSGNSALDSSVQRALDKVTFVAPFPDSEKSAQKTFWLEFDPRAKRMMG
jgi:TonB family protein